jgi:hypothetical protein
MRCDAMLTAGTDEAIGHEHERTVGERDVLGSPKQFVEDLPEAELVEQSPNGEDWPPGRSIQDAGLRQVSGVESFVASEHALKLRQHLDQEILTSKIGDDALLHLVVLAKGLDDADVVVDGTVAGADFDVAGVHGSQYHDAVLACQRKQSGNPKKYGFRLSLRFSAS